MPVEAWLADDELDAAAKPASERIDPLAHALDAGERSGRRPRHARGRTILAKDRAQARAPFAGGDAGLGAGDRRLHDVAPVAGCRRQRLQSAPHLIRVAAGPPCTQPSDLSGLDAVIDGLDRHATGSKRRGLALRPAIDADHDLLAGLDAPHALGVALHQPLLHVFDAGHGPAQCLDARQLLARARLQLLDLPRYLAGAIENIAELQQIRLIGEDLLQPQRPLLVPRAGQAHGLVPGRKLHGARACVLRQRDGKRLEQDAIDVVLGLLLGQAERVDLHAIAEAAQLGIGDLVALAADVVP